MKSDARRREDFEAEVPQRGASGIFYEGLYEIWLKGYSQGSLDQYDLDMAREVRRND